MKITIRVKPNARKNEVKPIDAGNYIVSVTAPPVEGKANDKVIEVLAEYFGKPKRCISLVHGETGKTKVIEIV
jgi:uncharacterized protein